MQDNWQEFDRQMKSVLQNAGEKVPGRVWRAVSSRLDSAAPAALWWRWAVPAFAVAAILAGLFLSGTFKPSINRAGDIDILADAGVTSAGEEGVSSEALALADIAGLEEEQVGMQPMQHRHHSADKGTTAAEPEAARQEARSSIHNTDVATAEDVAPAGDVAPAKEVVPAGNVAPAGEGGKQDAAFNQETADQWARIELEERRAGIADIKLSGLYAQGSLGGNDSNISYGGKGISQMAPGQGSEDAGISEAGQSTYGVPFTLGLGVRFHVVDRLSFGTGLDYSLLTRTFNGNFRGKLAATYEGPISHYLSYIGIPLNVYYDLLQSKDELFKLYAWAGGEAEYCIVNNYRLQNYGNLLVQDTAGGFQFSAALGLGLEFKLSERLGLYADPSVRYYFHGNQPKSVRTDKPFMFTFDAGLRFNF